MFDNYNISRGDEQMYLCIDLKSFYASCECVARGLDPFKVNLVVADESRGKGTICLAASPHIKELGVGSRCRLFEIPDDIDYIIAKPRMRFYMEVSSYIYNIYLDFFSDEDIHVYSIDEVFINLNPYLHLYGNNTREIAKMVMNKIFEKTGITATAGIGTNLYLAKIALDIISKHNDSHIGYLDEELFKKYLWHYKPLDKFWSIGRGISTHLNRLGIFDMYDLAHYDESILFSEFGINARLLIDHSWGVETATISDIKKYVPKSRSISSSQILFHDYNYLNARIVLTEMIDDLVMELVTKRYFTDGLSLYIGYSKDKIKGLNVSKKLDNSTCSFDDISKCILDIYNNNINKDFAVRRIGISFHITNNINKQLDLFSDIDDNEKEYSLLRNVSKIKNKYGKNSILRGISYTENANQLSRNKYVGGHNAE